jgi:uncharacterized membrane protein
MKNFSLYIMAALYIVAGLNHFVNPSFYMKIMPPWIPGPNFFVWLSGLCEIIFALLLLPSNTRPYAAWSIILLLIVIFPANIQMTVDYYRKSTPGLYLTILRLPLQILLIYWAYLFTKK